MPGHWPGLAREDRPDVLAVDLAVSRRLGAGEVSESGQHVECAGDGIAAGSGGDSAGPAGHARDSHAALVGLSFAASKRQVAALPGTGRAVVGGEQDQCLLVDAAFVEGLEQLAHRPVDLLHPVSIETVSGLATEPLGRHQWQMDGGVGQIQEEGMRLVGVDELDRLLGVLPCDGGIFLDARGDRGEISDQRQRDLLAVHVVAVGDAEVVVEALVGGHEVGVIAEVPLADGHRGVAPGLEHFGDGDF